VAKPKSKSKPSKKSGAKKPTKDQPPTEIDPRFVPVVETFANDRQVICGAGWGAGNTVLKVKGKIFAMTIKGDLVVKLSKARAAELVGDKAGIYFDPRHDGRLMKEWVVVESGKANWIDLAKEAHRFVSGGK
jgi:hypothetical protein